VKALQKLAKWRLIFAGWQLGTRLKGDPECDAVRDHLRFPGISTFEEGLHIDPKVAAETMKGWKP
jgi:hypothetical protein